MAVNRYVQGALVRVYGAFTDINGAAVDPATVSLAYDFEGGAETVVNYPAAIAKDSVGNYHFDIDTTVSAGTYKYRWYSTGNGQASNRGIFKVDASALG